MTSRSVVPASPEHSSPTSPPAYGPPAGWATSAFAPRAAEPEAGIPWGRYIAAVRRQKWIVLGAVIAGCGLGFGATRFIAPAYETQATIWINSTSQVDAQRGPIRAGELLQSIAWVELFRSFAITDAVVDRLRLNVTTQYPADSVAFRTFANGTPLRPGRYVYAVDATGRRYTLADAKGELLEEGAVGDSVGRALGFRWVPPASLGADREIAFRVTTPREASIQLVRALETSLPEESNFLRLRLTGADAARTAATLNALANQFVVTAAALKKGNLVEFERTLGSQLVFAERELKNAEIALEKFRAETIVLPSEGGPVAGGVEATRAPMLNSYFEKKEQFDQLRHDREALEGIVHRASRGEVAPDAILSVPGLLTSSPLLQGAIAELTTKQAELRTARQTMTEQHPTVLALAAAVAQLEQVTIPALSRSMLEQLRRREADMGRRISTASAELRDIPTRTIEEMRLNRQVAVSVNLYNTLKSRYEEASLAEAGATPDVTVLDSAVTPQRPSSNTGPRIMLLAIIASVGGAIGLVLMLDRFDRRFRYAEQATRDLGLPILGIVPALGRKRSSDIDEELGAQLLESFRSLRLGIRYTVPAEQTFGVAVTSPGVGEGKSLIASNLALSFAEAGYRTVLVDGDIRRGELHQVFGVARVPGLIDHLDERAPADAIVHETEYPRLSVVPSGIRRKSGPELLTSERLRVFVAQLKAQFDIVIIDTPPLAAGVDAFALSTVVGNVVLVLRTGTTDRHQAEAKLSLIDRLPVRVLGAVLNDATDKGAFQYYAYSYTAGVDDEQDEAPRLGSLRAP